MLPESSKLLLDIRQALEDIRDFTSGLDMEAYFRDAKCRAAVERKFEVMGEACTRLRDRFPEVFEKLSEARQMIGQAIQQLTGLSDHLIDQLDDTSLLAMLTTAGKPDGERLAVLGDLYQEEAAIFFEQGQQASGIFASGRALRLILEAALAEEDTLPPETMVKVEDLLQKLGQSPLPIDTQLALSDYYRRLLDMDDQNLAAGGLSRAQIGQALARLQARIDSSMDSQAG